MDALYRSRAEELASEFAGQATTVEELNELMRLMLKSGLERMLNTEMDVHLGRRPGAQAAASSPASPTGEKRRPPNRRNGRSKKTVQGDLGEVTLITPRDRDGTFEPRLIEKHQRRVPGFDEKILALYAKGMTTRDIQEIVRELYGVEVSATLVSAITEDLDAEVTAWRTRPLAPVWPIVYFDGITVHVRGASGRVSQHTIYVALNQDAVRVMAEAGVDISGQRSKHVDDLSSTQLDYVITVCDDARESCPVFLGRAKVIHRSFDDPPRLAQNARTEAERLAPYRRVRDEIREFIATLPEGFIGGATDNTVNKEDTSCPRSQCSDRRAHLVDDLPDDAEGRFRLGSRRRQAT
jgi:protein-tyrosine-phosphatase